MVYLLSNLTANMFEANEVNITLSKLNPDEANAIVEKQNWESGVTEEEKAKIMSKYFDTEIPVAVEPVILKSEDEGLLFLISKHYRPENVDFLTMCFMYDAGELRFYKFKINYAI